MARKIPATERRVLNLWLDGKATNTVRAYRYRIEHFLSNVDRSLVQLRLVDVEAYLQTLNSTNASTRAMNHSVLRSFLRFAHAMKSAARLDIDIPVSGPKGRLQFRRLMPRQLKALAAAMPDDPRNYAIIRLVLDLGLSAAEIAALKCADVTVRQKVIYVPGNAARTLDLPPDTLQALAMLVKRQPSGLPLIQSVLHEDHVTVDTIWRVVRQAGQEAGIDGLTVRTLRNTMIRAALAKGDRVRDLQARLGLHTTEPLGRFIARHG